MSRCKNGARREGQEGREAQREVQREDGREDGGTLEGECQRFIERMRRGTVDIVEVAERGETAGDGKEEAHWRQALDAEEKLRVVLAAAAAGESGLGELLRREGLHERSAERVRTRSA